MRLRVQESKATAVAKPLHMLVQASVGIVDSLAHPFERDCITPFCRPNKPWPTPQRRRRKWACFDAFVCWITDPRLSRSAGQASHGQRVQRPGQAAAQHQAAGAQAHRELHVSTRWLGCSHAERLCLPCHRLASASWHGWRMAIGRTGLAPARAGPAWGHGLHGWLT